MSSGPISEKIRAAERVKLALSRRSLTDFLNVVHINAGTGPVPFGTAAEPWQVELLRPKIPAFEALAGIRDPKAYKGPWSFLSVLARGHDKSSLEGRLATWLLLASNRAIHGYIIATDREQGQLILQAMRDEHELNPWYAVLIKVHKNVVTGPSGFVEVLPADAASAYGLRGNLFIADEVTHWKNQKMWNAIDSGREKISPSLMVVLSNAGMIDSWQWKIRQLARKDPDWVVFERPGQLASWMDKERIKKVRMRMPPSEGDRLFDNRWIDAAADSDYLRREEVQACVDLGKALRLGPRVSRQIGVTNYVASIDYAARKDRTVFCIGHEDETHRFIIDRMDVWQGSPTTPVSIQRCEDHGFSLHRAFSPKVWVVDEYQMAGTIEAMRAKGLPVEVFAARAGQANFESAQWLRSRIVDRGVAWADGTGNLLVETDEGPKVETLLDELVGLRVKRMPYGYRFDHENQKHDDRAVALCMAGLRSSDFPWEGPGVRFDGGLRKPGG